MSSYPLRVCLQMNLICLCLVFVSAINCGEGYVERVRCKSNMLVSMPLGFNVWYGISG